MGFLLQKYMDRGTSSPFVARTMVQTGNLLHLFRMDDNAKAAITRVSHDVMIQLAACLDRAEPIASQVNEGKKVIEGGAVTTQAGGMVTNMPSVTNLQGNVEGFLGGAKRALQRIGDLCEPFYGVSFGHRFHKLREWLSTKFGPDDPLLKQLEADKVWIEHILHLRDAVDHAGGSAGRLVLNNFRLVSPGPPIVACEPTWHRDGEPPSPIASDMEIIMENLLLLFEELLADSLCKLPNQFPLRIAEIPVTERDPQNPVRLRVELAFQDAQGERRDV